MKRNAFGQLTLPPHIRLADDGAEGGGDGDKTFTQADIDRIVADRAARAERAAREDERKKFSDYEDLKAKAAKLSEIQNSAKTDDEKLDERLTAAEQRAQQAIEDANKLRNELLNERVQSAFKSAASGRALTPDAVFGFNQQSFIKDGVVDTDAIKDWVEKNSTETKAGQPRVPGQGDRDGNASGGTVQAGRDLYDSQKKPRKD